jgi:hypothetical protein
MDTVELYVIIDDFCKYFTPKLNRLLKNQGSKKRCRAGMLSMSEIILILTLFPHSEYKCFKWYYAHKVCGEYSSYFRKLPSYCQVQFKNGPLFAIFPIFFASARNSQY